MLPWLVPLVSGLISGAGSLIGSKYGADVGRQSAEDQMRFQERMSSTAHTRGVEDLKRSGYNPILAATGAGASSPSGASFAPSGFSEIASRAVSDAGSAGALFSTLSKLGAEIHNLEVSGVKLSVEAESVFEGLKNLAAARTYTEAQTALIDVQTKLSTLDWVKLEQEFKVKGGTSMWGKLWDALKAARNMLPFPQVK